MLYREIIAVCSQTHTKHINTLGGQNVEFVTVQPGCIYSNSTERPLCNGCMQHHTVNALPNLLHKRHAVLVRVVPLWHCAPYRQSLNALLSLHSLIMHTTSWNVTAILPVAPMTQLSCFVSVYWMIFFIQSRLAIWGPRVLQCSK